MNVLEALGYSGAEAEYLQTYTRPGLNFIHSGSQCANLPGILTWVDPAYNRATGLRRGFFAFGENCTPELMQQVEALQRSWGSTELIGPVAPDAGGFFNGACYSDYKIQFCSPKYSCDFERLGFREFDRELGFVCDLAAYRLDERAARRFSITVKPLRRHLFSDPLTDAVYTLAPAGLKAQTARQAERISKFLMRSASFAAYDAKGICCGYLLTFSGNPPRITTLMTGKTVFSGITAAALLAAAKGELLRQGYSNVNVATINQKNSPSLMLARGCTQVAEYIQFIKPL